MATETNNPLVAPPPPSIITTPMATAGQIPSLPSNAYTPIIPIETSIPTSPLQGDSGVNGLVSAIRSTAKPDTLTFFQQRNQYLNNIGAKDSDLALTKHNIDVKDTHFDYSDGELGSRFKYGYIKGINNEELLAMQQGAWDKIENGVLKFGGKVLTNVVGGLAGIGYGIGNAFAEGEFNKIWNNDFFDYMDDLNKKMDYSLPNYKTQAEKDMSFIQSLGTLNFWTDDLLGGLSFLVGAIATEYTMGLLTGGASLATAIPRLGLRGARFFGQAQNYGRQLANTARVMNRTASFGRLGEVAHNARFMITSSFYEAGIEANHFYRDSAESFIRSYEETHGRPPTLGEYKKFHETAVERGNMLFASNVALVGASNIYAFGSIFGVGAGLDDALARGTRRLFGEGVVRNATEQGVNYSVRTANKAQRYLNTATNILKRPFVEGFVEEGGQAVLSGSHQRWLASRFNPDSLSDQYGMMEAMYDAIGHTYGTKQGFKEVGIGMLIGFLGGMNAKTNGQRNFSGIREASLRRQQEQQLATELNNNTNDPLTRSFLTMMDNAVDVHSMRQSINASNTLLNDNDVRAASMEFENAMYARLSLLDRAGLLGEARQDLEAFLNGNINNHLAELNMSESIANEFKEAQLRNMDTRIKNFERAKAFTDALRLPISNELRYSAYTALSAEQSLNSLFSDIQQTFQSDRMSDIMNDIFGNASFNLTNAYVDMNLLRDELDAHNTQKSLLEQQLASLESQYAQTEAQFSGVQSTQTNQDIANDLARTELQAKAHEQALNLIRTQINDIKAQINDANETIRKKGNLYNIAQEAQQQFDTLRNSPFGDTLELFTQNSTQEGITDQNMSDVIRGFQTLQQIIGHIYRNQPSQEDVTILRTMETLMNEAHEQMQSFRDFHIVLQRMRDKRFGRGTTAGKGIVGRVAERIGRDRRYDDSVESRYTHELDAIQDQKQYEEGLERVRESLNLSQLSEEQKFAVETFYRVLANPQVRKAKESVVSVNPRHATAVSQEEYDSLLDNTGSLDLLSITSDIQARIAAKMYHGGILNQNEQEIYNYFSSVIDGMVDTMRQSQGDPIIASAYVDNHLVDEVITNDTTSDWVSPGNFNQNLNDFSTPLDRVRFYINRAMHYTRYLRDQLDETSIPTQDQINRFYQLSLLGNLNQQEQDEYNDLLDLLHNWGKALGTSIDMPNDNTVTDMTLADALLQLQSLMQNVADTQKGVQPLSTSETFEEPDFVTSTSVNGNYDMAQSYENAMMLYRTEAATKKQYVIVSNVGLRSLLDSAGILNEIEQTELLAFEQKKAKNPNAPQKVTLTGVRGNQSYSFVVEMDGHGRLIFREKTMDTLTQMSNLDFSQTQNITKWNPLHRTVADPITGQPTLQPVPTDFEFNGEKINNDAIAEMKPGDTLTTHVLNTDYNRSLLQRLKTLIDTKSRNATKHESDIRNVIRELEAQITIGLRDSKGRLVGVAKSTMENSTSVEYQQLNSQRSIIAKQVFDNFVKNGLSVEFNTGVSVQVNQVYHGHPQLNLTTNPDGSKTITRHTFTTQMLDKVVDVGYLENGSLQLAHGTKVKEVITYPYLNKVTTNSKYKGEKIPVIIMDYNGTKIAYPIQVGTSVSNTGSSTLQAFDNIIASTTMSKQDKILDINNLLAQNGVKVSRYGLSVANMDTVSIDYARQKLTETLAGKMLLEDMMKNMSARDFLSSYQAQIEVDIANKPFHSPKIRLGTMNATGATLTYENVIPPTSTPSVNTTINNNLCS